MVATYMNVGVRFINTDFDLLLFMTPPPLPSHRKTQNSKEIRIYQNYVTCEDESILTAIEDKLCNGEKDRTPNHHRRQQMQ